MKNYLKQNPKKLIALVFVILFGILANIFVNIDFINITTTILVALFTLLMTFIVILQLWGEYKGIEGFTETIKQFFKW